MLRLTTVFGLKFILSHVSIATLILFHFCCLIYLFPSFYTSTFSFSVFLKLKWVSLKENILGSPISFHSASLYLLVREFSPFILKVSNDTGVGLLLLSFSLFPVCLRIICPFLFISSVSCDLMIFYRVILRLLFS